MEVQSICDVDVGDCSVDHEVKLVLYSSLAVACCTVVSASSAISLQVQVSR